MKKVTVVRGKETQAMKFEGYEGEACHTASARIKEALAALGVEVAAEIVQPNQQEATTTEVRHEHCRGD